MKQRAQSSGRDKIRLSPIKLPLPAGAAFAPEHLAALYKDWLAEVDRLLDGLRVEYADSCANQLTGTLHFTSSKLKGARNLQGLALALDNCGKLEPFAEAVPGYSAFRRMSLHMPKGTAFKPGTSKARQFFRQAQQQIGAKLILVVCLISEEEDNAQLKGARRAMRQEGFGQIMPPQTEGFEQ